MGTILLLVGGGVVCLIMFLLFKRLGKIANSIDEPDSEIRSLIDDFENTRSSAENKLAEEFNSNVQAKIEDLDGMVSDFKEDFSKTQSENYREFRKKADGELAEIKKFHNE